MEEHLIHLDIVLKLLLQKNLQLKPSKCTFATSEVNYLGYKISKEGIHTDEKKIETIKNLQSPKTQKQVRSFLGLINYYAKFIDHLAELACPLYDLTPKGRKFVWSQDCQESFEILKNKLCEAPILIQPDLNKIFHLQTDASDKAVGAILMQEVDNVMHPIGYFSRKLQR